MSGFSSDCCESHTAQGLTRRALLLGSVFGLLAGYACAWVGHFFFEHNRPATFRYPLYSFLGDWVMYAQMLTGKIRF